MTKVRIEIKNHHDLNDILSDMLTDFLEDFDSREGFTDPAELTLVTYEEGISFWYTQKAELLISRWMQRMKKVFCKYFDEHLFEVKSHYYKEL